MVDDGENLGTGEEGKRWVCEVCGAEFESEAALDDHVCDAGQVY